MDQFRKLYFQLFAAMADAVEDLENGELDRARKTLIRAQQRAEEEYVEYGEKCPEGHGKHSG